MPYYKEQRIVNELKGFTKRDLQAKPRGTQFEQRTPIATGMYLPNHSGLINSNEGKKLDDRYVNVTGDTMTGNLSMSNKGITGVSYLGTTDLEATGLTEIYDNIMHNGILINSIPSTHTIRNDSGDLKITNGNADKDIKFNLKRSTTAGDLMVLDASNGLVQINGLGSGAYGLSGQFNMGGSVTGTSLTAALAMNPSVTGANLWIAAAVRPTFNSNTTAIAFYLSPTFGATNNQSIETIRTVAPAHKANYNDRIQIITEQTFPRTMTAFVANDSSTVDIDQITLGGSVLMGDMGYTNATYTENMITLRGGASRIFGTGGSVNQVGLTFSGFGTQSGLIAGDSCVAMNADGGIFKHRYDYNGTTNGLFFGAGVDAGIGYNGTDLQIDTDLVGSGVSKWSSSNWTANGTNTVTVSNVAPSGVGTATISKWFTVKDNTGTVYYIPAWT